MAMAIKKPPIITAAAADSFISAETLARISAAAGAAPMAWTWVFAEIIQQVPEINAVPAIVQETIVLPINLIMGESSY
ncbi:hypothetical protein D3C86_2124650 [compost metagenome]